MADELPGISVIDVGAGGALRHAQCRPDGARALRDACLATFPRALEPLLPALDAGARRWLARAGSPYVDEIADISATLGFSGVFLLNASYLWGCTAVAREEDGVPWLARTLDWPFAGLGRHVDVVRGRAPAGEWLSVSWPGYAGALTATAPGRFAACLNQAPMWRRTGARFLRLVDLAANGLNTWRNVKAIPPDQLLRQAFETRASYADAKALLETTPLARPAIFTLVGVRAGERCVIERTENACETRAGDTAAANDWLPPRPGWEARIAGDFFFAASREEAAQRCEARRAALAGWPGRLSAAGFAWSQPPVLNRYTRLAVVMSPAAGVLRAAGFEPTAGGLPQPVARF